MSLKQEVLTRLQENHTVSILDCKYRFQCKTTDFQRAISDLRKEGHRITAKRVKTKGFDVAINHYKWVSYTGLRERPSDYMS